MGPILAYYYEIGGDYWRFQDNVSFQYDSGSSAGTWITESWSADLEANERTGILHRDTLDPGTLTITFTSWDGQYSHSYEYDIPGGPTTQVDTYIPTHPSQNYAVPGQNTLDGVSLTTWPGSPVSGHFNYSGDIKSWELEVRDGTVIHIDLDNGSVPVDVSIFEANSGQLFSNTTFMHTQGLAEQRLFIPAGDYKVEASHHEHGISGYDNTTSWYSFHIYYEDVNVIKVEAGSEYTTEWNPVIVEGNWPDNTTTRYYDVYISQGMDWRLVFTQAGFGDFYGSSEGNQLHFCLTDGASDWVCGSDHWGDFSLSSTSPGAKSWLVHPASESQWSWSGTWAAMKRVPM